MKDQLKIEIICPYDGAPVECVDSSKIYHGKSFGWAWVCTNWPKCDAYVGCHPRTKNPLGRLANKELRMAKSRAHRAFDVLWMAKMRKESCRKAHARGAGYKWLSEKLLIPREECHIGMMDVATCIRVVEACNPYLVAS